MRVMAGLAVSLTLMQSTPALAAAFTEGNLAVCRIGTGAAALSNAATAVFVDEYTPSGALVQSIALPTADSGANQILTASGTATSECLLSRSVDGQSLVITGYDAAPGTAAIAATTSAAVARTIGSIGADGVVDSSTTVTDAFSGNNIRSATTVDGSAFWATGGASGVRYIAAPGPAATTLQLSTTATNLRQISIVGGQLYVSAQTGAIRLATVGTGTPVTAGQTISNLPGLPTSSGSPYQFVLLDLSATEAGLDTLYFADDTSAATSIRKFSLVAGTWTDNGACSTSNSATRGLTGSASGNNVSLFATANGTTLFSVTDATGHNATCAGITTSRATAVANTAFRGVALTPAAPAANEVNLAVSANTGSEADATVITVTATTTAVSVAETVQLTVSGMDVTTDDYLLDGVTQSGVTLDFAPGESTAVTTFTVVDDALDEADETATLTLSNPTGDLVLGATPAQDILIADDDEACLAGTLGFSLTATTASERGNNVFLEVTRTGGSCGEVSVDYNTVAGTAVAGQDYNGRSDSVGFGDGDSAPQLIPIKLRNDVLDEIAETLSVVLSNVQGGATLGSSSHTITILDEDESPVANVSNVQNLVEGSVDANVLYVLSAVSGRDVLLRLALGGTATRGSDYTYNQGFQMVIPAGQRRATMVLNSLATDIVDDAVPEPIETVTITITSASGATLGNPLHTIRIIDND